MAAAAGLVLLLNAVDARTGIAVAAFGLVAVASGAALGFFADRLPEIPRARHGHHRLFNALRDEARGMATAVPR